MTTPPSEPAAPTPPDAPAAAPPPRTAPQLIVNTGPGKGKSTAAFGLALRGWHQGWSIGVFQFVKSGRWPSGERAALETLGEEHESTGRGGPVEWLTLGAGRTGVPRPATRAEHADAAVRLWAEVAARLAEQRHDLYVLDEFTYPLAYGWLSWDAVGPALAARPGVQHVVVTGRDAPAELVALATTVTRMDAVKHPFEHGQRGQAGIEW